MTSIASHIAFLQKSIPQIIIRYFVMATKHHQIWLILHVSLIAKQIETLVK